MFCPKCGSILRPKKEGAKKIVYCGCGYKDKEAEIKLGEVIRDDSQKVEVIREEHEVYPLVEAHCPKCSHKKAYFWTVQTRAGDEPETKFFRCEKCKHTWRDYS